MYFLVMFHKDLYTKKDVQAVHPFLYSRGSTLMIGDGKASQRSLA